MRSCSKLVINLSLFQENLHLIQDIAKNSQVLFMIKANAYGHGMLEMAKYAFEFGVRNFGVATLHEAVEVRKNLPQLIDCDLYVFSETCLDTGFNIQYGENKIIPVVHNQADLKFFLTHPTIFSHVPLVLKFDTGMCRLGISDSEVDQVVAILKKYKRDKIFHLMTHFSTSYFVKKENDRTEKQDARFKDVLRNLRSQGIEVEHTSVSNSGAIEQKIGLEQSFIRPGLMLYGPQSTMTEERLWKGFNISSLTSMPLKIFPIKKGDPIGYGAHIVHEDGVLMLLPIGYGDGILNYYQGMEVKHGELNGKIIARVNMDLTYIFFEKENVNNFKKDLPVIFWGNDARQIEKIATDLKTIPYQLFCSLSSRIPRQYIF